MDSEVWDYVQKQLLSFPAPWKEVDDLTNQERIALCIASGCKMEYRMENADGGYRMVATTVNPVGIVKVGQKFIVYERK